MQAVGVRTHIGKQGVGGVHDPLGFAGGTGSVEDLDGVVGGELALGKQGVGVLLFFPGGFRETLFKATLALSPDDQQGFEIRQLPPNTVNHGLVVKATKDLWYYQQFGLAMLEHEAQFPLPENRHERIQNRADTHAGQMQGGGLPPVR